MSRDEIIRMAREAGFVLADNATAEALNRFRAFAALVAAKEREACAQVCEENQEESLDIARGALVTEQGASHERSESA